jgi:hypothetical protein
MFMQIINITSQLLIVNKSELNHIDSRNIKKVVAILESWLINSKPTTKFSSCEPEMDMKPAQDIERDKRIEKV